jgi:hypothetical protein
LRFFNNYSHATLRCVSCSRRRLERRRERAVQGELQESAGRIRWASGGRRCDALEAERRKIKLINKGIEKADRVLFCDRVVETLRKEHLLVTVCALDVTHNSTKLRERGIKIACAIVHPRIEF